MSDDGENSDSKKESTEENTNKGTVEQQHVEEETNQKESRSSWNTTAPEFTPRLPVPSVSVPDGKKDSEEVPKEDLETTDSSQNSSDNTSDMPTSSDTGKTGQPLPKVSNSDIPQQGPSPETCPNGNYGPMNMQPQPQYVAYPVYQQVIPIDDQGAVVYQSQTGYGPQPMTNNNALAYGPPPNATMTYNVHQVPAANLVTYAPMPQPIPQPMPQNVHESWRQSNVPPHPGGPMANSNQPAYQQQTNYNMQQIMLPMQVVPVNQGSLVSGEPYQQYQQQGGASQNVPSMMSTQQQHVNGGGPPVGYVPMGNHQQNYNMNVQRQWSNSHNNSCNSSRQMQSQPQPHQQRRNDGRKQVSGKMDADNLSGFDQNGQPIYGPYPDSPPNSSRQNHLPQQNDGGYPNSGSNVHQRGRRPQSLQPQQQYARPHNQGQQRHFSQTPMPHPNHHPRPLMENQVVMVPNPTYQPQRAGQLHSDPQTSGNGLPHNVDSNNHQPGNGHPIQNQSEPNFHGIPLEVRQMLPHPNAIDENIKYLMKLAGYYVNQVAFLSEKLKNYEDRDCQMWDMKHYQERQKLLGRPAMQNFQSQGNAHHMQRQHTTWKPPESTVMIPQSTSQVANDLLTPDSSVAENPGFDKVAEKIENHVSPAPESSPTLEKVQEEEPMSVDRDDLLVDPAILSVHDVAPKMETTSATIVDESTTTRLVNEDNESEVTKSDEKLEAHLEEKDNESVDATIQSNKVPIQEAVPAPTTVALSEKLEHEHSADAAIQEALEVETPATFDNTVEDEKAVVEHVHLEETVAACLPEPVEELKLCTPALVQIEEEILAPTTFPLISEKPKLEEPSRKSFANVLSESLKTVTVSTESPKPKKVMMSLGSATLARKVSSDLACLVDKEEEPKKIISPIEKTFELTTKNSFTALALMDVEETTSELQEKSVETTVKKPEANTAKKKKKQNSSTPPVKNKKKVVTSKKPDEKVETVSQPVSTPALSSLPEAAADDEVKESAGTTPVQIPPTTGERSGSKKNKLSKNQAEKKEKDKSVDEPVLSDPDDQPVVRRRMKLGAVAQRMLAAAMQGPRNIVNTGEPLLSEGNDYEDSGNDGSSDNSPVFVPALPMSAARHVISQQDTDNYDNGTDEASTSNKSSNEQSTPQNTSNNFSVSPISAFSVYNLKVQNTPKLDSSDPLSAVLTASGSNVNTENLQKVTHVLVPLEELLELPMFKDAHETSDANNAPSTSSRPRSQAKVPDHPPPGINLENSSSKKKNKKKKQHPPVVERTKAKPERPLVRRFTLGEIQKRNNAYRNIKSAVGFYYRTMRRSRCAFLSLKTERPFTHDMQEGIIKYWEQKMPGAIGFRRDSARCEAKARERSNLYKSSCAFEAWQLHRFYDEVIENLNNEATEVIVLQDLMYVFRDESEGIIREDVQLVHDEQFFEMVMTFSQWKPKNVPIDICSPQDFKLNPIKLKPAPLKCFANHINLQHLMTNDFDYRAEDLTDLDDHVATMYGEHADIIVDWSPERTSLFFRTKINVLEAMKNRNHLQEDYLHFYKFLVNIKSSVLDFDAFWFHFSMTTKKKEGEEYLLLNDLMFFRLLFGPEENWDR